MSLLFSLPLSRLIGASRCSLPCTLILTLLFSIATGTPTAPATSRMAPSRTRLRLAACTAIWPPVASVMEPDAKSTVPALEISTRDSSRRSAPAATIGELAAVVAAGARKPSRWLSSASAPLRSNRMAVVPPSAKVILPPSPKAFRCTVPRVSTDVLDSTTPPCTTSPPVSVTSPIAACIKPVFTTRPGVPPGVTSLPLVVDARLPDVPWPRLITKLSPAAISVWPDGVLMAPAFAPSLPSSSTYPPPAVDEAGAAVWINAPACTSMLPRASRKVGCVPLSAYRPLSRNWASVIVAAAATRLRAFTWLVPVKITPFWFTTITVPSALIAP